MMHLQDLNYQGQFNERLKVYWCGWRDYYEFLAAFKNKIDRV
jgi:hypothetical protein